jgi:hypothetical protein
MATFDFDLDLSLVTDRAGLDRYLNDPQGELGQQLDRLGRLIIMAAKRQVGVDTGDLRDSIRMVHRRIRDGQSLWIGSYNHIALAHHEGTRPHTIRAQPQKMMRFSNGGRIIYSHKVNHPGTRPNRYLSDQLYIALG